MQQHIFILDLPVKCFSTSVNLKILSFLIKAVAYIWLWQAWLVLDYSVPIDLFLENCNVVACCSYFMCRVADAAWKQMYIFVKSIFHSEALSLTMSIKSRYMVKAVELHGYHHAIEYYQMSIRSCCGRHIWASGAFTHLQDSDQILLPWLLLKNSLS